MKQHFLLGTLRLLFLSPKVILDFRPILQHPHPSPSSSSFLHFPSSQGSTGVCGALGKPGSLSRCFHPTRKLWLEGKDCGSLADSSLCLLATRVTSAVLSQHPAPLLQHLGAAWVSYHTSEPSSSPQKKKVTGSFLPHLHLKMAPQRSREHPGQCRGWRA